MLKNQKHKWMNESVKEEKNLNNRHNIPEKKKQENCDMLRRMCRDHHLRCCSLIQPTSTPNAVSTTNIQ